MKWNFFFSYFWKKIKSLFFYNKFETTKARLANKIVIKKATVLLEPTDDYKKSKKKVQLYNLLKKKYSRKIIHKKQIVTIGDFSIQPDDYIVEIDQLNKYFLIDKKISKILININFKIRRGDFLVVLGPSGSGKSTLLNVISGIDSANSGNLFVEGYNLNLLNNNSLTYFRRQYVGFIFQQYNLLQNLNGSENVEIGEALLPKGKTPVNIKDLLEFLEIADLAEKYPFQLSGGQQQRFSIARALAKNPNILFCDEPTGALDEKISKKVMKILFEINRRFATTIVLVTHNEKFAKMAKTVVRLSNGRIIKVIKNENPLDPELF